MNNKGVTLIELIVSIALLSILALFLIPAIISVRHNILEKVYESRVSIINNAALNWASDNLILVPSNATSVHTCPTSSSSDCACITIGDLIMYDYLTGTDNNKTIMKNPVNNENINDKYVCVRYNSNDIDNRKMISSILE